MNDKTAKALASAISDLAKALTQAASAYDKRTDRESQIRYMGGGGLSSTYTVRTGGGGGGGGGGVGGLPGGVSPRTGGGGGGGGDGNRGIGGAALAIVGEAGAEYLGLQGTDIVYRPAHST